MKLHLAPTIRDGIAAYRIGKGQSGDIGGVLQLVRCASRKSGSGQNENLPLAVLCPLPLGADNSAHSLLSAPDYLKFVLHQDEGAPLTNRLNRHGGSPEGDVVVRNGKHSGRASLP
jgi:hypothetical protein